MRFRDFIYSYGEQPKWAFTANPIKLFAFDWRLAFAFVPIIFNLMSIWSYVISFSIVIFCQILKVKGLELPTLVRLLHFKLIGKRARSRYKYEIRRYN